MRKFLLTVCVASLSLGGCGAEATDDAEDPQPELEEQTDDLNCGGPSSAERYYDGISKVSASGRYTVTIVSSDPAPPVKGDNALTIQVTQNDAPADVGVVVSPFMPHHNHGTAPANYDGVPAANEMVEVPPFYLFMPGYWEYTVKLTGVDGDEEDVVFAFCVDG